MKKKPKRPFLDPANDQDRKKAIEALKEKNLHLDEKENEKIKGGFIETGRKGHHDKHDDEHGGG